MHISIKSKHSTCTRNIENPNGSVISGQSAAYKFLLCMIFLAGALAIFLLGANYYQLFTTNGNTIYAVGTSSLLLIAALILRNNAKLNKY
jgi:hypothetical protein